MMGKRKSRSGPNIHLLYSEIDSEKQYHEIIERATTGYFVDGFFSLTAEFNDVEDSLDGPLSLIVISIRTFWGDLSGGVRGTSSEVAYLEATTSWVLRNVGSSLEHASFAACVIAYFYYLCMLTEQSFLTVMLLRGTHHLSSIDRHSCKKLPE